MSPVLPLLKEEADKLEQAISESLKGYAAPKAHIHSAGVSPVSVRIYIEI